MVLAAIALSVAILVAVPIVVLATECLVAALLGRPRATPGAGRRGRCVVLIPAHDEERTLPIALDSVGPQLRAGDRIVVVAHNCSDDTAGVARAAGAEAVEVSDDGTGGKPDALKAGLAALDADAPATVVIVDADCEAHPGAIDVLARAAEETGGPVQGTYLFAPAGEDDGRASISSLALLVKNLVRPVGLRRLGLPCLLNGAGSAYPFDVLRHAPHGEGSIAEDYQLSVDLALRGHPTRFVAAADVRSTLPADSKTAYGQRKRWEHGHLHLVLATAPRLMLGALRRLDPRLFALALDLAVPPLALLALLWTAAAALTGAAWWLVGAAAPATVVLASGALLFVAILAGWLRFAGPGTTLRALARVPAYVLWKVPLYLAYLGKRQTRWQKTRRDHEG
jgi:cellulose synthase/poly-beta-1,6-N-acetylglucosamine synthase-like glycosyltransferase